MRFEDCVWPQGYDPWRWPGKGSIMSKGEGYANAGCVLRLIFSVLRLFYDCFATVLRLFCDCFATVLRLFYDCFTTVLRLFCDCFATVLRLFCDCFTTVLRLFCDFFTTVLRLIWVYFGEQPARDSTRCRVLPLPRGAAE